MPSPPAKSQIVMDSMTPRESSLTRTDIEKDRLVHVCLARQCAEQLMKLHIANGAQKIVDHDDARLMKYHIELERLEGGHPSKRKITVLVPRREKEKFRQVRVRLVSRIHPAEPILNHDYCLVRAASIA